MAYAEAKSGSNSIARVNIISASPLACLVHMMITRHPTQKIIIGMETFGRLMLGLIDLGLLEFW